MEDVSFLKCSAYPLVNLFGTTGTKSDEGIDHDEQPD